MNCRKKLLLLVLVCVAAINSNSQTPKPAAGKPLTLSSKFAAYTDSSKPFVTDLKQIVQADLRVTDNTGVVWTIVTYRLGWRRKQISDDYKTGQRKTIFEFYAKTVDNSPKIPAAWQTEMKETLQAGEELMFEEIIVQNPTTKKMMKAPVVHLFLK